MDLSVKESDVSVRAKLHNRVASYRAELHRLAKEFARAKCTVNIDLGIVTLMYRIIIPFPTNAREFYYRRRG